MAMQYQQRRPVHTSHNTSKANVYSGSYATDMMHTTASYTGSQRPSSCQVEANSIESNVNKNGVGFDSLLSMTRKSTKLWSKIKICSSCSSSQHQSTVGILLRAWYRIVGLLEVASSTHLKTASMSIMSTDMSGAYSTGLPPMNLGQLELDPTQSKMLTRCLIKDILKELAAVLYEMRRAKRDSCVANFKGQIDSVLSKVLSLMAGIP